MNDSNLIHPVEECLQRAYFTVEDYVRREPAKAVGIALGAGLLLKMLPSRVVAGSLAATTSSLLPPALLGLGLLKALELCEQQRAATAKAPQPE